MSVICHENNPPNGWDRRLYTAERGSGLCQSTYWARVIEDVDHARPIYLEALGGERKDVILSLLLFHKIPWNRHKHRRRYRSFCTMGWTGWLEWLDGPVIYSSEKELICAALDELLAWIENYARKQHLAAIYNHGLSKKNPECLKEEIKRIFIERSYKAIQWATYLVDLQSDEKTLWGRLDHAARKGVNKARRSNIRVKKIGNLDEFKTHYYLPYVAIESAFDRRSNPWSVAETQWLQDHEGYYHYYIAESPEGETLATLGMYLFNEVATEIASTLSPKAFQQGIPAQDLLHWEMLLEAKKAGCHIFDLAGINPKPMSPKEEGIRRFKMKWGGKYVEFSRYEKVYLAGKISRCLRSFAGFLNINK